MFHKLLFYSKARQISIFMERLEDVINWVGIGFWLRSRSGHVCWKAFYGLIIQQSTWTDSNHLTSSILLPFYTHIKVMVVPFFSDINENLCQSYNYEYKTVLNMKEWSMQHNSWTPFWTDNINGYKQRYILIIHYPGKNKWSIGTESQKLLRIFSPMTIIALAPLLLLSFVLNPKTKGRAPDFRVLPRCK